MTGKSLNDVWGDGPAASLRGALLYLPLVREVYGTELIEPYVGVQYFRAYDPRVKWP